MQINLNGVPCVFAKNVLNFRFFDTAQRYVEGGTTEYIDYNAPCEVTGAVERENYGSHKISRIVDTLFGNSYLNVVQTLVREEKVTEAELLQLLEELKKRI